MTIYTEDEQEIVDETIALGGTPIELTEADTDAREREILLARHMNLLAGRWSVDGAQQQYADAQARRAFYAGRRYSCSEFQKNDDRDIRINARILAHVGAGLGDKTGVVN